MKNSLICTKSKTVFSFSFLFILMISCSTEKNLFPEQINDLTLSRKLSGEEAKEFVNKLHFNAVTDENNEIGFYGLGTGGAIIYVTYYRNNSQAKLNFEKMTEKISPENSVFIMGSFFNLNGIRIYRCFGMGQTHFVFNVDTELFWLSVPTLGNEKYLNTYLNYID